MSPMSNQLRIPLTFQLQCWHCHAQLHDKFKPAVERTGLRCNCCGKFNSHDWDEHDHRKNVEFFAMYQDEPK